MTIPYTYLVGWTKLNLWYYGCQYGVKANPKNLWTAYFTSSTYVKELRDEFGEPDVIQVRKTFTDPVICKKWEERVINRLDAVFNEKWLNRSNGGACFNPHPEKRARSMECREKISIARKRWCSMPENKEWVKQNGKNGGHKGASKISEKAKARYQNVEWMETVYKPAHNTREYIEGQRIKGLARLSDPEYVSRHLAAVTTPEYREKQRADSVARYSTQESRDAHSAILKAALSSPEARAIKSAAAKASTAKRLETRRLNKLAKESKPTKIPT